MSNEVRISGAQTTPRSEADIAAFHGDNTKVIAASNVIAGPPGPQAQFYSSDGGASWGQSALPLSQGDSDHTDPEVGWSTDGTPWAMVIGFPNLNIRLYSSNDGGNSWAFDSTPSGAVTGCDREAFWVDTSMTSPFKDYQYAAWQTGALRFARRTGSTGSWDAVQTVSGGETTGNALGCDIRTNNYGDLFVFWPDAVGRGVFVRKSINGGGTFPNAPTKLATQLGAIKIGVPSLASRLFSTYVSGGAYRDATRDIVHAVWADLSGEMGCTSGTGPGSDTTSSCKSRIWYSRSTNGGVNWTTPAKINDSSSKNDQFHPALAVDPTNGNLAVIYYDTIADSGRKKVDVWMQISNDDGATWSTATRVTSKSTDETGSGADLGNQYGDYIGLDLNAGVAFPSWCDRRNGASEEIWTSTMSIAFKELAFILERSTFGQDEVQAIVKLNNPNPAVVSPAFFIIVDGFSANDLDIHASDYTGAPMKKPTLNVTAFGGLTIGDPIALTAEDETNFTSPQRFTWTYAVSFTDDSGFTQPIKVVNLSASISTASGNAQLRMLQQPNPFEVDGDPAWLSTDLRVFQTDENGSMFGAHMNGNTPAAAVQFIKDVISNLNSGSSGGQTFDVNLDPAGAPLALFPQHLSGKKVFNFAVAKVRYNSLGVKAKACRVFFRLIPALTVSTAYDTNTVYRRYSDNIQFGTAIARLGLQNNNILSIPCFAETRVQTDSSKANPVSMDTQLDASNVQDLPFDASGKEVDRYFGCWLDINQPNDKWFALNPTNDGPFSGTLKSVLELVRNQHQCLVAEIAFDSGDPIPAGATPFTSDKLAQRNLDLVPVANPGVITSRSVPSTFELKPTPANVRPSHSDELMIHWGHLPAGSTARIYLPTVNADEIIAIAAKRYSPAGITKIDDHTIEMPVRQITYVPIPPGPRLNHTGLLTIDLPLGIRRHQRFAVAVRQVSRVDNLIKSYDLASEDRQEHISQAIGKLDWRYVLGAFQIDIPVQTKEEILVQEERLLALLRWILHSIPPHDRWYPVFHRYVGEIAGRVRGLGGDPEKVPPSTTWVPKPLPYPHPGGHGGETRTESTGKVAGLVFDHFGDFEGFVLETEEGERAYKSREAEVKQLAERAWAERLRITVISERDELHRPLRIIVHEPPAPFRG